MAEQLFGKRHILGEPLTLTASPYTVVGKIRKKKQDSNYSGPDNNKIFVPFARDGAGHAADATPTPGALSDIIVAPKDWVVDAPAAGARRAHRPDRRHRLAARAERPRASSRDATASIRTTSRRIAMWDTSLQTLMFGRMIGHMKQFFTIVGVVTLALGGIGVMNIMLVAVKERTREIGVRKALGATTAQIQRQFFLEGFFLTLLSGGARHAARARSCAGWSTWRRCPSASPA